VARLAWRQIISEKARLVVAMAGVAFAVILMFVQLGFRDALFESAVGYYKKLRFDLVLLSPKYEFIGRPVSFSRRRAHQAAGVPGVVSVAHLYIDQAHWRNPWTNENLLIHVTGVDPTVAVFDARGVLDHAEDLKLPDTVLFDALSRPEYGPVASAFESEGAFDTEVNNRKVSMVGVYELGTSFGYTAGLVTSDLNFLRLFPRRSPGPIDLALIDVAPEADVDRVRRDLDAMLDDDVEILTRGELMAREVRYWNGRTPVSYVFTFGVVMGLVVGAVIVYQILFADVADHMAEYATLKAMGYSNLYLCGVVLQEALILAVLGFVPGWSIASGLYRMAGEATMLPLRMTAGRISLILVLTLATCAVSALVALRKVRSADPAEIF
jgi:putative ABC transport system permease protein